MPYYDPDWGYSWIEAEEREQWEREEQEKYERERETEEGEKVKFIHPGDEEWIFDDLGKK